MRERDLRFTADEIGVDESNESRARAGIAASPVAFNLPLDPDAIAQGMIHQVAVGETKIGFVAGDAEPREAGSQGPNGSRKVDGRPTDRFIAQRT